MDIKGIRIQDFDRRTLSMLLLACVLILAVLLGFFYAHKRLGNLERRLETKRADMGSFSLLAGQYMKKRTYVKSALKRAYAQAPEGGGMAIVAGMVKKVGAGGQLTAVKPVGEDKRLGYTITSYSVKIEGVNLNQVVNLIYLIENNRALLVIKGVSLKSRFDDPDMLDARIKLGHVAKPAVS